MKKLVLLMIIGIMLSISLLVGVSYALWSNTHVQETENIVETGCFSTDFSEVNSISLSNSYPISDDKGMNSTPYQFTITNTCTVDAKYEVNFEVLAGSTLSSNYVKLAINDIKDILSNYEVKDSTINGALSSNNIASGWLKPEQSITYDLRLWIDEATTLEQGEEKSLNGKVVVVSAGGEGPNLINTLLAQYDEANIEYGLLKDSENPNVYYYKGTRDQVANNYLWYGGHQWQVVEFNVEEGTLRLRTSQPITNISLAKRVWSNEEEYQNSYLMTWLKEEFYDVLPNEIKNNIVESTYNVGIETDVDSITATSKYGLLDVEEYKRGGEADSFLDNKDYIVFPNYVDNNYWAGTENNGLLELKQQIYRDCEVFPVITIKDVNIESGLGTLNNSFKIESQKSTNTSNVLLGEYISVPTSGNYCGADNMCLFRVVKYGESGLKVTLNGTLPELKNYLPDPVITKNHEIYKYVGEFVDSISDNYKSMVDEKIYMSRTAVEEEMWDDTGNMGYDYKNLRKEYLLSSYGLPSVGEMFTTNDIDLFNSEFPGTSGFFVDQSVVENYVTEIDESIYTIHNFTFYYLMNKDGYYNNPNYMNGNGYRAGKKLDSLLLVRPVMHLKYNLSFTGGSGTAQDPYTLN